MQCHENIDPSILFLYLNTIKILINLFYIAVFESFFIKQCHLGQESTMCLLKIPSIRLFVRQLHQDFHQSPPSDYFSPNSFYCSSSSVNTVFLFISHLHIVLHTVYKSTPSCFSPSKGNSICFLMNQLQLVLRPTTPSLSIYSIWFMNQLHQVFSVDPIETFISQLHMYLH